MQSVKLMRSPPPSDKSAIINRQEALNCIPVRNATVQSHELDSGDILVEYPLLLKPLFKALHKRFHGNSRPPTRKLELDTMGSLVWNMIDGENSTQTIIKRFSSHYSITLQEAETSVTTFLLELGKRGLIGMQ